MIKMGIFVGENGLWNFFEEIYADFNIHYETTIFNPKRYQLPILSGRINNWFYRNSMRAILRKSDICFFEWASEMLAIASHMPKYAPIVTRLHSFELADWAHRVNWEHVDKIIFVSEAVREKFLNRYPAYTDKAVLVYNAIPVEKFTPSIHSFDFSIGMLCTINPIKRVYEAILVVKELLNQGHRPTLHIAGGPIHDNFEDRYYIAVHGLVNKLGLEDVVKFYGHVDDPSAWLQRIDIFISNSFWEGLQTALIEAMASGCYCLSHFWDGAEEVLPIENIYDTDAQLILKLITYAELPEEERARHKSQMREIAQQKFNINDKKPFLRDLIESVC